MSYLTILIVSKDHTVAKYLKQFQGSFISYHSNILLTTNKVML
jgi:hypothetical protein